MIFFYLGNVLNALQSFLEFSKLFRIHFFVCQQSVCMNTKIE